jgi:FkbM family methyltransferase
LEDGAAMSSPTVSVVMSVFNGEEFLSETIDSVLNQTFRDFEFVIVDDGSTDATADILSKYALCDGRIRVLRNGKKGRAASLNLAISVANGKYVANTDADDLSMPGRLEEQVAFMEKNLEVGVLGGAFELITDSGAVIDVIRHPLEDSLMRSAMLRYNPICHSSVILRKNIVLASGGYRSTLEPSEDYDLWLKMSECSRMANLHNVIVRYRLHANQLSVRKVERQTLCNLAISAAVEKRRSGRSDPLADIQEITPQAVQSLGVTPQKIHTAFVEAYGAWSSQLRDINSEAALELIEKLTQLSHSGPVEPRLLADAWLAAARIHYKQKQPARALVFAGRTLLLKPSALTSTFIDPVRGAFRVRFWHPLLNLTRPIRHTLGLRLKSVKATDKEVNVHKDSVGKDNVYRDSADREFAGPRPHFVKQKVLLRNDLRDAPWVETGTFMGDATGVLSKAAKMVYSIEPEPPPLVFDVGANTGAKTEQYLRNGARVVCFEPQSGCVDALRERFRGNDRVVVVSTALGAHNGEAEMSICTQANTISTFADAWKTGRFKDKIWDRTEVVPVTTLDVAIDRHGMPFYCKIDVEGFEQAVLSGLTRQIPVLSFEFCAEGLDNTQACLDLLSRLGYAAFNVCLGDTRVYLLRTAVSSGELMNHLRSMSDPLAWGDVYAAVGLRMPDSTLLPRPLPR